MAEREGFETSFLKNDTAFIVGFSGSQKFEHIYPHINTPQKAVDLRWKDIFRIICKSTITNLPIFKKR